MDLAYEIFGWTLLFIYGFLSFVGSMTEIVERKRRQQDNTSIHVLFLVLFTFCFVLVTLIRI
jgi:hypothetical protein